MKWINHEIVTGVIIYTATDDPFFVICSMIGAIIPDKVEGQPPKESKAYWKWRSKHRTYSHLPAIYLLIFAMFTLLTLPEIQSRIAFFEFARGNPAGFELLIKCINAVRYISVGCLLHIAEDGICGKVPIIFPKKKYGIKLFKVGSTRETVVVGIIIFLCIVIKNWEFFSSLVIH